MLIDKSQMFLDKMAKVVLDAQWAYPGNQMKMRTQHLSNKDTLQLVKAMKEQEAPPVKPK